MPNNNVLLIWVAIDHHLHIPPYLSFLSMFMFCPLAFLTIFLAAYYLPQNAGAIARKYIQDPQLLSFIDAEVDTTCLIQLEVSRN